MPVVARRYQQPAGGEPLHRRNDRLVQRRPSHLAGGARRQRHVDRKALARPDAPFLECTGARIEPVLVDRRIEDIVPMQERVLGAVAVMCIHVDDGDPLAGRGQRGRGHSDRVEQAEAHRCHRSGVVPRWPHDAIGRGGAAPAGRSGRVSALVRGAHGPEFLHSRQNRPRREQGRIEAGRAHGSVGVQVAAAGRRDGRYPVDHLRAVHQFQLRSLRSPRCATIRQQFGVDRGHAGQGRSQAVGPLGVSDSGVMIEEALVGDHQHSPDRTG